MFDNASLLTPHALFAALAVTFTSAHAENWYRCDSCNFHEAQAFATDARPLGDLVIHSAQTGAAFGFFTAIEEIIGPNCQPNSLLGKSKASDKVTLGPVVASACRFGVIATPVPLTTNKQELVDIVHGAYLETQGTMKTFLNVNLRDIPGAPAGPGPVVEDPIGLTAYDVQNNFQTQIDLGRAAKNYVVTQDANISKLTSAVTNWISVRLLGTEWQVNLVITMPDGSKVRYDLTSQSPTADLASATDPRGLPVMALGSGSAIGYVGTGEFARDQDASNFLLTMIINGVAVTETPGRIGNAYVCHRMETGVTCRRTWIGE